MALSCLSWCNRFYANLHCCFHMFEQFIHWTGRGGRGGERQWLCADSLLQNPSEELNRCGLKSWRFKVYPRGTSLKIFSKKYLSSWSYSAWPLPPLSPSPCLTCKFFKYVTTVENKLIIKLSRKVTGLNIVEISCKRFLEKGFLNKTYERPNPPDIQKEAIEFTVEFLGTKTRFKRRAFIVSNSIGSKEAA